MKYKYQLTLILPVIVICIFTLTNPAMLSAQTKKGDWLAEGNLGNLSFSNNKYETTNGSELDRSEERGYTIAAYPRMGYFINDNFAIGTTLNFNYQKTKHVFYYTGVKSSDGTHIVSSVGIIPYLRYYIAGKNPKNRFYGQLGAGTSIDLYNNDSGTAYDAKGIIIETYKYQLKEQVISGEALIGFNHFFTDNVALNTALGYNYNKITQTSTSSYSMAGIPFSYPEYKDRKEIGNIVWNFGFTIIIPCKMEK